MKKSVFLLLLGFALISRLDASQSDSSTYIYLKTGDYVFGDVIRIDEEHAGSIFSRKETNMIFLDNQRYNASRVRFFIRDNYRYAVVQDLSRGNEPDFAVMIKKGKINLYESKIAQGREHNHREVARQFYYNRGMGPVQRFSYRDMEHEYGNHSPALDYLDKSRRMHYAELGTVGFSLLYMTGSLAHYFTRYVFAEDSPEDGKFFLINPSSYVLGNITFNIGLIYGGIILSNVFRRKKDRHLLFSVDAYNKVIDY